MLPRRDPATAACDPTPYKRRRESAVLFPTGGASPDISPALAQALQHDPVDSARGRDIAMTDTRLFRIAGWSALVTFLLMVAAIPSFFLVDWLGVVLEILALLTLTVVFYALHVVHRSESSGLSLAGLILMFIAIGADLVSVANYGNDSFTNLWYLAFSMPFLIFGLLGYLSARMQRGPAVVSLLTGAVYLVAAVGGILGSQDIRESASSLALLAMFVWLVWIWRVLLSSKLTTAAPAATPI